MNVQQARQEHIKATDAYEFAIMDGCHCMVKKARRALRSAAKVLIAAQYAAGEEPCDYMAGARPSMFKHTAAA